MTAAKMPDKRSTEAVVACVQEAIYLANDPREEAMNAVCALQPGDHLPDGNVVGNEITFQARVAPWMRKCFGPAISGDKVERNHRFLEEALELVQANGATKNEAYQLVDYVYGRPAGEINQEVGGVMVTLAALCLASRIDMHDAGDQELGRIWTKIPQIRGKQASKPRHSPLPQHVDP